MVAKNIFSRLFDQESAKVEKQLQQKLIITMVGDVNAGKSSTIKIKRLLRWVLARVKRRVFPSTTMVMV